MKKYYLNEKGVPGKSYSIKTFEEIKRYFEPFEGANQEEVESYNEIKNIDDMEEHINKFINPESAYKYSIEEF